MDHIEERIRQRAYLLWIEAGQPEGQPDQFWFAAQRELEEEERGYDKALADSFPASDPPASSGITGPEEGAAMPENSTTRSTQLVNGTGKGKARSAKAVRTGDRWR